MILSRRDKGALAEKRAYRFLKKHGLKYVTRNFYGPRGEIDLIMRDASYLVFIEVRMRNNARFGSSIESIAPYKQQRIIHTAQRYLYEQGLTDQIACRFDVVGIDNQDEITWIKNAFAVQ